MTSPWTGVVIVCGGRRYGVASADNADARGVAAQERYVAASVLARQRGLLIFHTIRHGNAAGADRVAHDWALANGLRVEPMPAEWRKHGKRAGPIRNAEMLAAHPRPDAEIAFTGGAGTADMVRRARSAGVPVVNVFEAHRRLTEPS